MDTLLRIEASGLVRLIALAPLIYAVLVATLRVAGKRTLAKMNAFDLVVTVSLGSTLSSAILTRNVTLTQGIAAIVLLVLLQFLVAWSSVRVDWMRRVTRSDPTLLFHKGHWERDRMRRERVTESEVRQAMRSAGHGRLDRVEAVVLESDGTFSVIGEVGDLVDPIRL